MYDPAGAALLRSTARAAGVARSVSWGLASALWLAGAALAGSPEEQTALPEPTLEAFMQGMARTSGIVARFREVKHLGLLSDPLEVRGTLTFVPPDRLARLTTEPSPSRMVIDGDRFAFQDEAGGEVVDLAANPMVRQFVDNFIVLFNGDLASLRERYEPDFRTEQARWTLALRPRRRPVKDLLERITLEGEGRTLARMEILETDGDRTTTFFDDVEIDRRFGAEELARIFAIPGTGAEAR